MGALFGLSAWRVYKVITVGNNEKCSAVANYEVSANEAEPSFLVIRAGITLEEIITKKILS